MLRNIIPPLTEVRTRGVPCEEKDASSALVPILPMAAGDILRTIEASFCRLHDMRDRPYCADAAKKRFAALSKQLGYPGYLPRSHYVSRSIGSMSRKKWDRVHHWAHTLNRKYGAIYLAATLNNVKSFGTGKPLKETLKGPFKGPVRQRRQEKFSVPKYGASANSEVISLPYRPKREYKSHTLRRPLLFFPSKDGPYVGPPKIINQGNTPIEIISNLERGAYALRGHTEYDPTDDIISRLTLMRKSCHNNGNLGYLSKKNVKFRDDKDFVLGMTVHPRATSLGVQPGLVPQRYTIQNLYAYKKRHEYFSLDFNKKPVINYGKVIPKGYIALKSSSKAMGKGTHSPPGFVQEPPKYLWNLVDGQWIKSDPL